MFWCGLIRRDEIDGWKTCRSMTTVGVFSRCTRDEEGEASPACRIVTSRGEGFDICRSSSRYNGWGGVALNCDDRV
jgi:hypothetical protein